MKQALLLSCLSLWLGTLTASAQNTLNVHQKDGTVVRYAFSEKPTVTYTAEGIHLVTTKVEVDYPMENLEKWTFSEVDYSGIDEIRTDGITDEVFVYSLGGTLVKTVSPTDGAATFSIADLPAGIYVIKNGNATYKITKR